MPIRQGYELGQVLEYGQNPRLSAGLAGYTFAPYGPGVFYVGAALEYGPIGHHRYARLIATSAARAHAGGMVGNWTDDFYDRFHVTPSVVNLGNLVGTQVRDLLIWNAFRRPRTLQTLDMVDGEGIEVSGQPAPPLVFMPLQERAYTLTIGTDGPPSIDAAMVFSMDEGLVFSVRITGSRVTPWLWRPDWTYGVGESLEWLTDVIESENGTEQTVQLRLGPRRTIDFTAAAVGNERQAMETALAGWSGRVWSVPIWQDGAEILAPVPIGTDVVSVPTQGRDFYPGGLATLVGSTWRESEVVEVLAVNPGQVQLRRATGRAWPLGTVLYPARTARLIDGAEADRFTGQVSSAKLKFDVVGASDWPELADLPTYRGLPVLEDRPEWSKAPTLAFDRKMAVLDNQVGARTFTDRADIPMLRQAHRWSPVGRAQLARIRSLLYLLRGKARAVWVPSWAEDFTLTADSPATNYAMEVQWQGYTQYINRARGRRDVRISSPAGVQYARITGAVEVDANTERLTVDAPMAHTWRAGEAEVQYLTLWRLDTDRLEFAWWSGDLGSDQATADVPMPMRTFRHDV